MVLPRTLLVTSVSGHSAFSVFNPFIFLTALSIEAVTPKTVECRVSVNQEFTKLECGPMPNVMAPC